MSDGLEQWRAEALEVAEVEDGEGMLPSITRIDLDNMPELRPELIEGVLRVGHVMMVGGASKVGKTFLLIELALAIATGGKWLGMNCRKGRVLYVNLEVDSASFLHRCKTIIEEWQFNPSECMDNVGVWNLRGHVTGMESFTTQLIDTVKSCGYEAVIIDPTYKVMDGDENAAKDVRRFTNELDRIASKLNIAVIYCAHHSKGAQGDKRSIDRVSGSGVFSRHGDAIFDLIELKVGEDERHEMGIDDVPCFRVAITLRDFKSMQPFEAYFKWPRHIRDYTGALSECPEDSSSLRGGASNAERTKLETLGKVARLEEIVSKMMDGSAIKRVKRSDVESSYGASRPTVNKLIDSSKKYMRETGLNQCWIVPRT